MFGVKEDFNISLNSFYHDKEMKAKINTERKIANG